MCFTCGSYINIGPELISNTQSIFSSKIQTATILSTTTDRHQEYVVQIFQIKKSEVLLKPISLDNGACIYKSLQTDGLLATIFFDTKEKKMCLKVHESKENLLPCKKFKMEISEAYTSLKFHCEKVTTLSEKEYTVLERIHNQFLESRIPIEES